MGRRFQRWWGPVLTLGFGLAILNQWAYPSLVDVLNRRFQENRGEYIHVADVHVEGLSDLAAELTARNYLDLASSRVHDKVLKEYSRGKEAHHDCEGYSNATADVYRDLVARAGRSDLTESLRIVAGYNSPIGHAWLQVREGGAWIDYEPQTYTPPWLNAYTVREFSEESRQKKRTLRGGRHPIHFRSRPGTEEFEPTLESYFLAGGLARLAFNVAQLHE